MRIDVSGKQFEVTDAIERYAEQKCGKLPRYYDGVQSIEVVIERIRPEYFQVELRVDVEKHDTFVSSEQDEDVYRCVDVAENKMARQLRDFKEKLRDTKR